MPHKLALYALILLCAYPFVMNGQTTHHRNEITRLTQQADEIVIGTVDTLFSSWNTERSSIYSYAELTSNQVLKGNYPEQRFTIRLLGGRIGDVVQWVSKPQAQFHRHEKVLVFISRHKPVSKNFTVVNGPSGKYSIHRDVYGNESVFSGRGTNSFQMQNPIPLPMDTLKQWISESLANRGSGR